MGEIKSFYVSLTHDLMGVYIEFKAESETAVRQYLAREYLDKKGVWKLPWCAVYSPLPAERGLPQVVVMAGCGAIYEEPEEPGW